MAEDLTEKFIREARERGEPVINEGTFRVVDEEGHVEIVDPAGPPGSNAYAQRSKEDLAALAVEVGVDVKASASKEELVRALVDLDENPRFIATPESN